MDPKVGCNLYPEPKKSSLKPGNGKSKIFEVVLVLFLFGIWCSTFFEQIQWHASLFVKWVTIFDPAHILGKLYITRFILS